MKVKLCGDTCIQISDLASGITEGKNLINVTVNMLYKIFSKLVWVQLKVML